MRLDFNPSKFLASAIIKAVYTAKALESWGGAWDVELTVVGRHVEEILALLIRQRPSNHGAARGMLISQLWAGTLIEDSEEILELLIKHNFNK